MTALLLKGLLLQGQTNPQPQDSLPVDSMKVGVFVIDSTHVGCDKHNHEVSKCKTDIAKAKKEAEEMNRMLKEMIQALDFGKAPQ